jgi:hypothetical protein
MIIEKTETIRKPMVDLEGEWNYGSSPQKTLQAL